MSLYHKSHYHPFVFFWIILIQQLLILSKLFNQSKLLYIFVMNTVICYPFFHQTLLLKGWLTVFFLGLIVFMGCSLACVHACFFLKTHYFSHNLPLFHTSLSLLWQTPRFISWFYEAPPSEIRDGLRLVSWLSVLWFAKPPLLHVWTSCPSPQWHVLQLNCKQWRCL